MEVPLFFLFRRIVLTTVGGIASNLPAATGAAHPVVLGARFGFRP